MWQLDSPGIHPRKILGICTLSLLALVSIGAQAEASQTGRVPSAHEQVAKPNAVHHFGWSNPYIAQMVVQSSQALVDVLERTDQSLTAPDHESGVAANNLDYAYDISKGIELQMPYVEIREQLDKAKGRLKAGAVDEFIAALESMIAVITGDETTARAGLVPAGTHHS